MLRGHGCFSTGQTLEEAFFWASVLEECSDIILEAKLINEPFIQYRKMADQYKQMVTAAWAAGPLSTPHSMHGSAPTSMARLAPRAGLGHSAAWPLLPVLCPPSGHVHSAWPMPTESAGPYIVYTPRRARSERDAVRRPPARQAHSHRVARCARRRGGPAHLHALPWRPTTRGEGTPPYKQLTCYAESRDGLSFVSDSLYLGPPYLRTFQWQGYHYGFGGGGPRLLYRSETHATSSSREAGWRSRARASRRAADDDTSPLVYRTRHVGFHRHGARLDIYYSNVGDEPERIKMTSDRPAQDWSRMARLALRRGPAA